MPVSSALVTRFFQLLVNRRFAEAERELERIKQKMHKTEWNRGYFRALYGMLIVRKSNNDDYAFLSKLDLDAKNVLRNCRKDFQGHVKSKLDGDFDRGFFSAWAKFMGVLSKLAVNESEAKSEIPEKTESNNFEKDKSQAKIESFLRVKA
jgi:hypothetical protein